MGVDMSCKSGLQGRVEVPLRQDGGCAAINENENGVDKYEMMW